MLILPIVHDLKQESHPRITFKHIKTLLRAVPEADKLEGHYNEKIGQCAIHLLHNQFNNAVSRFHLQHHKHKHKDDKDWLEKYPSSQETFQQWCTEVEKSNTKEDQA
eukprot:8931519-Ditylum_brightwellii.AAC.1